MQNHYILQQNWIIKPFFRRTLREISLTMKILFLFLICSIGILRASDSFAQNISVSLNIKNQTVESALSDIEKATGYGFFINNKDIDLKRQVSAKVVNKNIRDVLDYMFAGTNVHYQIIDNQIVLSVKKAQRARQSRKYVSGTVKDRLGEVLIGVTVAEKGTGNGTITDINGNYKITTQSNNPVLIFSYIGYRTQEIAVIEEKNIHVVLQDDTQELNEVVVTALGIKRAQKALSYNVQQVSNEDLLRNKDVNLVNSLSGKVAGVNINSSSSGVGGASKVVMRGTRTITQSSNALYVIDGIPMYNFGGEGGTEFGSGGTTEAIADLNSEDIESISVLTGAAAAALYGSDASNGAIVITTKKGLKGKTSVTFTSNTEISNPFVLPNFQNTYGTGDLNSSVTIQDKSWGRKLNASNYQGYSPQNDYFRTGLTTNETISFSTGTEKNQTYLSASVVNSKGIVPNNSYDRYNFTFRNTTSFFKDKMTLDIGGSYIHQEDQNMVNQGVYSNPLVTAYLFPRGDDWEDIKMYERYDSSRKINTQYWPQGINEFIGQNPYWINYRNLRNNNKNRYMMNASLSYDITDFLNVSGRVRMDNSVNEYEEKLYASTNKTLTSGSDNGSYGTTITRNKQFYADVLVNFNKMFNDLFSVQANVGVSLSDLQEKGLSNNGPIREDGIPNLFNVFQLSDLTTARSQVAWHDQSQSVFASAELGYKSSYYLTLTARNDWPSQLAGMKSGKCSFFYPSVGGSVILSEVFNLPKQIDYAKLRASYASVGLPFARFLASPTYSWDNKNKVWNLIKNNYPMYNLKPEKTNSLEVGITLRLFKKINVDLSYYQTRTYNQTFDPKLSVSSGYKTLYVQTGNVENKGLEFSLGYKNTWNDLAWSSNYTLSSNKNTIIELVDNYVHPETGQAITKDRLDIGGLSNARFILKKNGGLGDLYSIADLQRDSDGKVYVNKEGKVNAIYKVDDIKLGSVFPKVNMAWRNDFNYKNFNLGFMISARIGGIVYSDTQATLDLYGVSETTEQARDKGYVMINRRDKVNPQNWYTTIGAQGGIPQYYTYSATNVRLQEASLGYTFPRKMLRGIAELSLSVVGRNLLMIYNKAPFDPESVATTGNYYQGIDFFMMPNLRNVGFNLRLKF